MFTKVSTVGYGLGVVGVAGGVNVRRMAVPPLLPCASWMSVAWEVISSCHEVPLGP